MCRRGGGGGGRPASARGARIVSLTLASSLESGLRLAIGLHRCDEGGGYTNSGPKFTRTLPPMYTETAGKYKPYNVVTSRGQLAKPGTKTSEDSGARLIGNDAPEHVDMVHHFISSHLLRKITACMPHLLDKTFVFVCLGEPSTGDLGCMGRGRHTRRRGEKGTVP